MLGTEVLLFEELVSKSVKPFLRRGDFKLLNER